MHRRMPSPRSARPLGRPGQGKVSAREAHEVTDEHAS